MVNNQHQFRCHLPEYVREHPSEFGPKTTSLALLLLDGYNIPAFVALSVSTVADLAHGTPLDTLVDALAKGAHESLLADSYAVRSSAVVEDGANASHAGEFLTITEVGPNGLVDAIRAVINDAVQKGYVTTDRPFSLIIQKYIAPRYSGVIFTRDPRGKREAVIEWRTGRASEVVGGAAVLRAYRNNDRAMRKEEFPRMSELFTLARKIETHCDTPQDIEWAREGDALYILQSRPITTISREQFVAYKTVDAMFSDKDNYYLSRRDVAETFGSCTPLALELLRNCYAPMGPIVRAYQALHVKIAPEDCFRVHHGALYVDKEKELLQFFPAYGYEYSASGMVARIVRFKGLWRTIANGYRLSRLSLSQSGNLRAKLRGHMEQGSTFMLGECDSDTALKFFDEAYEDIFTVNLLSEFALRHTEKMIGKCPYSLATLLLLPGKVFNQPFEFDPRVALLLRGNSLNIADEESFVAHHENNPPHEELLTWWHSLRSNERAHISRLLFPLQDHLLLREEGRHLTVLLVSILRNSLRRYISVDHELLYFGTLAEFKQGRIELEALKARKKINDAEYLPEMPTEISTVPIPENARVLGISAGRASGIITLLGEDFSADSILLTDRLSPDIAPLLAQLRGIIATEGGMLSHLAIVAREAGIPVVVDPEARKNLRSGMRVSIDGGKGVIDI